MKLEVRKVHTLSPDSQLYTARPLQRRLEKTRVCVKLHAESICISLR